MPLNDTQIKKVKAGEKPLKLYDERGLYLEVRATSTGTSSKWWRLKYRFDGKEKLLSLGTYPERSLAKAREARDEARALLAGGVDPSQARKDEKTARAVAALNHMEAVSRAWLKERAGAWTEGTLDAITASLENHVFPELGKRPISEIKPADIRRIVKAVEAAGASETAGRVFQRLRAIFRHAVAHELLEADPTYSLKPSEVLKPRKTRHRAALSEHDAPAFLRKLDAYEGDQNTKAALGLLMLTAVRPGELRGARWAEFELKRALWRIPAERMKMQTAHVVPLSTQAVALVESMRELTGHRDLVFPSPFYPEKPLSENTFNSALARMGYKGLATAHGMRTLFSTCANEAGWSGDIIEKQLAHEERDEVRAAYNRAQHLTERAKLMQWYADHLDKLRAGAEVISFKAA
jgi:integrase